ncbi:MAG: hypothetical protein HYX68_03550 [Planctomycetes bacterium]|nr:hypothetical protein [Planctomycetota bacterium]
MNYNPIIRNFCRLRRVLVETLGLPRAAVRPSAKLANLIPPSERRRVWEALRRENLDIGELSLSIGQLGSCLAVMLAWMLGGCLVWRGGWFVFLLSGLLLGLLVAEILLRRFSREIYPSLTVGDAVLATTKCDECREAGYRLTRNEIFLKVRRVVAHAAGVDPSEITPATSFTEDLGLE